MTRQPIRVDIVSDVVCPWCAIGYRQLQKAVQDTGIAIDVYWHPFELNPQMADEGENLRDHLAAKYGTTPEDSARARARLTALGADLGFAFNFTDDMRMWNTFRAHQLIDWAAGSGKAHAVKMALFAAYFTKARNISDPQVLAELAQQTGLDRDAARAMLDSGAQADAVRAKERFWTARGISGVPAMIFDKTHLLTGAQGEATYARILDHITQEPAA